eukprot:s4196_g2.t1
MARAECLGCSAMLVADHKLIGSAAETADGRGCKAVQSPADPHHGGYTRKASESFAKRSTKQFQLIFSCPSKHTKKILGTRGSARCLQALDE